MADVQVNKLQDVFVIKRLKGTDFFVTTEDSFIIPTFHFSSLLKFLVFRGLLSPKVLQGILDEYYNSRSS